MFRQSPRIGHPRQLANEILSPRPELLLTAAFQLYPKPDQAEERRPFLERDLATMSARPGPIKAQEIYTKARLCAELDQPAEAIAAYRQALALEPHQQAWRLAPGAGAAPALPGRVTRSPPGAADFIASPAKLPASARTTKNGGKRDAREVKNSASSQKRVAIECHG